VDGGVGQAAVGVESFQEALAQVLGAVEEHLVARELVGTEQSSELTNGGLKERNFAVLSIDSLVRFDFELNLGRVGRTGTYNVGKVEVSVNPISTFLELITHVHNVKGVQSIDDGYTKPKKSSDRVS
jgi:hypothetical protein